MQTSKKINTDTHWS